MDLQPLASLQLTSQNSSTGSTDLLQQHLPISSLNAEKDDSLNRPEHNSLPHTVTASRQGVGEHPPAVRIQGTSDTVTSIPVSAKLCQLSVFQ